MEKREAELKLDIAISEEQLSVIARGPLRLCFLLVKVDATNKSLIESKECDKRSLLVDASSVCASVILPDVITQTSHVADAELHVNGRPEIKNVADFIDKHVVENEISRLSSSGASILSFDAKANQTIFIPLKHIELAYHDIKTFFYVLVDVPVERHKDVHLPIGTLVIRVGDAEVRAIPYKAYELYFDGIVREHYQHTESLQRLEQEKWLKDKERRVIDTLEKVKRILLGQPDTVTPEEGNLMWECIKPLIPWYVHPHTWFIVFFVTFLF